MCSDLGLLVTMRWSKTNQFGQRSVQIPLPKIPGSALYPWFLLIIIPQVSSFGSYSVV